MSKNKMSILHHYIVKFILWYLTKKCGGASHVRKYGVDGRYLVVMSDLEYHSFKEKVRY